MVNYGGPGASIEMKQVAPDTTGSYLPWAYGQKACRGKRFSQVEIVAVLCRLFRNHTVVVSREAGETQEQANVRAKVAAFSTEKKLLNKMENAASVGLCWILSKV